MMNKLDEDKKFSELVLEERDKGNVVFLCIDSIMCAPVKEIIKQPTDGLLWDLNRDEATALTFMDKEGMIHWVNNFAVALVIRELKKEVAQLEAKLEASQVQNGESAGEYVARRIMDIFQEVAEHVGNGVFDLDHPAPIIRGSIAMTNAWNAYISQHPIDSAKSPPNSA